MMHVPEKSSVEPVVKVLNLAHDRQTVFDLFVANVGEWWPLSTHCISTDACSAPAKSCAFERRVGGAFYEIMANGERRDWGRILIWKPNEQIAFTWHPGRDASQATHVSVAFEEVDGGRTRLTLTHSEWHVLGDDAIAERNGYDGGWDGVLTDGFLAFAKAAA